MTNNEPVMDGAGDDMSDAGTSRAEANEMVYDGREDQVEAPLATEGMQELDEDPLANSQDPQDNDRTGI